VRLARSGNVELRMLSHDEVDHVEVGDDIVAHASFAKRGKTGGSVRIRSY
jgi:hypothetical protein